MGRSAKTATVAAIAALSGAIGAWADELHVPGEYPTIQAAIDAAVDGDEVVIADGTYTGEGNKNLDFGGRLITVRSASGDPETCIIDCEEDGRAFHFHSGETAEARVEGLTIRDGLVWEDGPGGAGVFCESSSPSFDNCRFVSHFVYPEQQPARGAAMALHDSSPMVTGCVFLDNTGDGACAAYGGAVFSQNGSPVFEDCIFEGNIAKGGSCASNGRAGGGALASVGGSPSLIRCRVVENLAWSAESSWEGFARGGGVYFDGGGVVIGCLVAGNTCEYYFENTEPGLGGVGVYATGLCTVVNSTVVDNTYTSGFPPEEGVGVYIDSGMVENTIIWDNSHDSLSGPPGATVEYNLIEGGWDGEGNIDADPLFVDPDNGDFRLGTGSPAIDAGDNTAVPEEIETDLDGNPRFVDDPETEDTGIGDPPIVDMGAYEYQIPCPADLDDSGTVDVFDLLQLLGTWGPCADCAEDLDGSGAVDVFDLLELLGAWGECA
jgi:hypothetical protein